MAGRNPKTSYCEVRKVQFDATGSPKTIGVVAVVRGEESAVTAVEHFERRLTEEEKKAGISYYWAYTSRRIGRGWRPSS